MKNKKALIAILAVLVVVAAALLIWQPWKTAEPAQETPAATEAPAEQPAEQPAPVQKQYVDPAPAKSEKSNKGLYVIIVILLLLLLCFVGYFLLNQPKGGQTTEPETADSTLVEAPADNETAAQQSAKTDKPATAKPAGREIIVNGEGVRMRFGPSLKAGYLKTPQGGTLSVNKGTHLPCVGEEGDWYKVVYQGKQYYMSKQFCLPAK